MRIKAPRSQLNVQTKKSEDRGVQGKESADHGSKTERSTNMEELERCFHQKELKTLLSSDPVLKILKPKLIGLLQGPVSAPVETPNQLEAIRRLLKLLKEAGFTAGAFDAQILLDCDHDQVIKAGRSLFEALIPLTGKYQAIVPATETYQTGSSQYASAESEADSGESVPIQRMS